MEIYNCNSRTRKDEAEESGGQDEPNTRENVPRSKVGSGDMAPKLGALAALPGDPGPLWQLITNNYLLLQFQGI